MVQDDDKASDKEAGAEETEANKKDDEVLFSHIFKLYTSILS